MYLITQEMCSDVANKLAAKPVAMLFPQAITRVSEGSCATCNLPIRGLKSELSLREFCISGMCQNCQDGVFGAEDDPK